MELMPRDVKMHLYHKGDNGQIKGFDELFTYLGRSEASAELRKRLSEFFRTTPSLKGYLSGSYFCNIAVLL